MRSDSMIASISGYVRLDQSGHHAALPDVEDLGVGPDQRFDVGPAADGCDPAAHDGQHCSVDDKFGIGHRASLGCQPVR